MTASELADRNGLTLDFMVGTLELWRTAGIAEETGGRWHLTPDGLKGVGRGILDASMLFDAA